MPGRIFPAALFRYGVVAPAAQRIAPGDAPCRQQQSFDAAVGADGLDAVLAAGGRKAAVPPQPRADELLVEPDEPAEGFLKDAHASGFRTGGRVAGGFAPGCFALSGRPAWAKSFATMALSCQLLSRGVMPRATKTRS